MPDASSVFLFDTHCHLADSKYHEDLDAVLARATGAGIDRVLVVGDTINASRDALRLASKNHLGLFSTTGVHPHNASQWNEDAAAELRELCHDSKLARGGKIVALGEIGLDYHYDFSPREKQMEAFLAQAEIARECSLPLVLHCRDAYDEFIEILRDRRLDRIGGVVHCFGGNARQAMQLTAMGFLLGVTGVLTFKKNHDLRESVGSVPLESLVLETDGPYLAPVPHRGQRNEPAFLRVTAECLARELGLPLEEVAARTTANACKLFGVS